MSSQFDATHISRAETSNSLLVESPSRRERLSTSGRSRSKSPGPSFPHSGSSDRSKNELQKVLSLIVERLVERIRPPTLFEQLSYDLTPRHSTRVDTVVESLRAAVRTASETHNTESVSQERLDELDDGSFSTSSTLDLMTQMRDILVLARKQGWDILAAKYACLSLLSIGPLLTYPSSPRQNRQPSSRSSPNGQGTTPFRRRRSRADPKSSRLNNANGLDLRSECVALLEDVVMEDCRYKVAPPTLMKPPYALQAVCLDIGVALMEETPSPETLAAVGEALLPAFDSFDPILLPRLLACFDNGIVRPMLRELTKLQGIISPNSEGTIISARKLW